VNSDQCDVSPKDKAPKIQLDPVAAPTASEQRPIQEIDRNRQQPKNQTNNQMFAPDGFHHLSLYQISRINTPVVMSSTSAWPLALREALVERADPWNASHK
jgi:hypothetical protein